MNLKIASYQTIAKIPLLSNIVGCVLLLQIELRLRKKFGRELDRLNYILHKSEGKEAK